MSEETSKPTILKQLCRLYVGRQSHHALSGKKRDDDMIAFMAGAASALQLLGREADAQHVGRVNHMIFSIRGYRELERIVEATDA